MILHGDELGRTQQGNNNTSAQDSELTWEHWDTADQPLIEFVAALARLRQEHPTFRRKQFFDGRPVRRTEGEPLPDITWFTPSAEEMVPEDWEAGFGRSIGVFLDGEGIPGRDGRGERIVDVNFLLLFNAHDDIVQFTLPSEEYSPSWEVVVDTAGVAADAIPRAAGDTLPVQAKSLVVLRTWARAEAEPDHSVAASLIALANGGAAPAPEEA
jgi:glycogen operon protein